MPIMIRHGGMSQTAATNLINYLCDMGAFDLSHDSFVTEMTTQKIKRGNWNNFTWSYCTH